jgi:cysteine desulfurase/selenocysteine lyase
MTATHSLPLDPYALREDFPILQTTVRSGAPLIYLDNAATTQHPRQVIQAMVGVYERQYANVHRGIHWLSDQSTDLYEEARAKVCRFINARSPDEIVFTRGTTEAINLVARSWGDASLNQGDEILLTEAEHHSNIVPWQQLAARRGAVLRYLPLRDDGLLDLDALPRLLSPRTRLVAVSAVTNVLGTIHPLTNIIRAARQVGALVLVDAAQSVPHFATDVQALGADFVAFSGHKMLGPSGVGVLYGRREVLEHMPPFLGGGSMIRRVTLDGFEPADIPARFEAGTPPIVPAIGLGAAIDYLLHIGLDAICRHERLLLERAHAVLSSLAGVRLLGPAPQHKGGIVSFVVERMHAHDVAHLLDRYGIAVRAGHHCAMPLHKRLGITASTRASFYLYNTLDEVDQLGRAVDEAQRLLRRR